MFNTRLAQTARLIPKNFDVKLADLEEVSSATLTAAQPNRHDI